MSGTAVAALSGFDDTMKSYLLARGISAGQLAVTYRGRLVLARGYGNNSPQLIQPTSLFRVARLSKSLTAAAIVRLGYSEIDPPLWRAARAVTSWPTHNFWSKYYA
ncbi:serine hydrolase [Micromonospora sp. C28SCA-DRY-2]|uniref:serine hydrolase n=1 Tax=Micromonospora sp. C28SCA-DRY-2 TaxID=3059522 RepID=UPI002674F0FC|nr:serine hydrolase [Micromonospora sp. C28SCA-DRY-2]MDO3703396.1 serine hydrolase [Micromonospora sp. C28SCA-DRY-2]